MKRLLISSVFGALFVTMAHGAASFELAAKATNDLGVDLYRQLATGDENLCISPYSIDSALAMTFAGADGETRDRNGARSAFSKRRERARLILHSSAFARSK